MFWLQKGNVNSVLLWSRWFLCAMIYVIQTYCQARNIEKGREILHEVKDSSFGAWRGARSLNPRECPRVSAGERDVRKSRHSYMQTNKDEQIELPATAAASDFKTVISQSNAFKTSPHTISSTDAKAKSQWRYYISDWQSNWKLILKPKRQYLIIPELSKIDVALWFHNRAASHHVGSLKMTVIKCLARIVHP